MIGPVMYWRRQLVVRVVCLVFALGLALALPSRIWLILLPVCGATAGSLLAVYVFMPSRDQRPQGGSTPTAARKSVLPTLAVALGMFLGSALSAAGQDVLSGSMAELLSAYGTAFLILAATEPRAARRSQQS